MPKTKGRGRGPEGGEVTWCFSISLLGTLTLHSPLGEVVKYPLADRPTVSDHSRIEWTEATWNPVTSWTKVSPGCKHCYAERLAKRLKAMGSPRYRNGFRVTLHEDVVELAISDRGSL